MLQDVLGKQADVPLAYVALAQVYIDTNRGAEAVKLLEQAQAKFPVRDVDHVRARRGARQAEAIHRCRSGFRQVLAQRPDNAPALNYLGYMLADRGERLDESVDISQEGAARSTPTTARISTASAGRTTRATSSIWPPTTSSARPTSCATNSVIQDHYGEVLFKLGRYDDAIAAWTRALAGDGDSIDRAGIDKKIRSARQKLGKK